ncbi:type II toxin-antitoxin system VapC family toxin [Candidatus Pacearchaeota archaeon]|nr:type II toxin-antitoxin system VapC family toxin [Candidatus Pacearchaeota archaeon]
MIFLDSSYLISLKLENDENHDRAVHLMKEITIGEYGSLTISDYIFDEVVTILFAKGKKLSLAIDAGEEIMQFIRIYKVDEEIFQRTWKIFKEQKSTKFSFTDCSIIAIMKKEGIKNIATFDEDFRKVEGISVID